MKHKTLNCFGFLTGARSGSSDLDLCILPSLPSGAHQPATLNSLSGVKLQTSKLINTMNSAIAINSKQGIHVSKAHWTPHSQQLAQLQATREHENFTRVGRQIYGAN